VTKSLILLLVAPLLLVPAAAGAEVYEFELPVLAGAESPTDVSTSFVYHGPNGDVTSLSGRFAGTIDYLGLVECYNLTEIDTIEGALDGGVFVHRRGESGQDWSGNAGFLGQVGPFDGTFALHTYGGGFTTVADGDTIEVSAYFFPAGLIAICHYITGLPTGTLSYASILIDVSTPVRAESTVWGRIKSLYR
jgi:hypothetical protein